METEIDGHQVFIDEEDAWMLNTRQWKVRVLHHGPQYVCHFKNIKGKTQAALLHRVIMGAGCREQVDHINGNGLDNRRCNLRLCTHSENQWNRTKYKNNTSGYKGVFYHEKTNKWEAGIRKDGKRIYLGVFTDPASAHEAYKSKALELYGEYAHF
jgi:hypothetical protein